MDSRLPLSPWASDGFFLLVRRLPGWPQAMWGHRRSYCVTSAFGDSQRTPRGARTSYKPLGRMLAGKSRPFCCRRSEDGTRGPPRGGDGAANRVTGRHDAIHPSKVAHGRTWREVRASSGA